MKWAILGFATMALAVVASVAYPPQPKTVHGEGCVQAGVEPHCLVLKDLRSGNLYDLLMKGARPPVGLGIEFTGVLHNGPTACMTGIAIDVTEWARKESLKCAPGEAGKH